MEVVAEARSGREAVQLAQGKNPDLVIMDISMPDLNGMEATSQMIKVLPNVKVIALSMHSDRRYILGMFRAGALGFLLKDCAFEELAGAINTVIADQPYLSPSIASTVIEEFVRRTTSSSFLVTDVLTAREREVLQLLAEGWPTKEIASHLHVSVKTVETHRKRIMEKLDLNGIAELTKYAIREGLTSLDL